MSARHLGYHEIKTQLLNELFRISDEVKLLREVKDIKDEIEIISSILTAQRKVVQSLSSDSFHQWRQYSGFEAENMETQSYQHVEQMIDTALLDFSNMFRHAESAEASLNHLLDLKNKEANLHEAHTSNERAEEAVRQSQTVLIFTMVTIVFLPLSFMSSFFAIGVTSFPHDSNGNLAWPLHEVSGYIFGMTFALALPLLVGTFAISSGRLKKFYHRHLLPATVRILVRFLNNRTITWMLAPLGLTSRRLRWTQKLDRVDKELQLVYPNVRKPRLVREATEHFVREHQDGPPSSYYYTAASSYYYSYSQSDSDSEVALQRRERRLLAARRQERARRRAERLGYNNDSRARFGPRARFRSQSRQRAGSSVAGIFNVLFAMLGARRRRRVEEVEIEEY